MTQPLESHGFDLRAALLVVTVVGILLFAGGVIAGIVAARIGPFHNAML